MMQPSAFDEALALPFLSERTEKKKWSFASSSTSTAAKATRLRTSMLNAGDYEDEEDPFADLASEQEAEELVHTETVIFGDDALIQERHGELMGINDSLKHINTIHQDLAGIVEAQEHDIKRMSWFAIESFENTESGLEQVVRAGRYSDEYQYSQRRKTVMLMLFGVMAVLGLARAALAYNDDMRQHQEDGGGASLFAEDQHESGINQLHTPMIYIPSGAAMMQP